MGTKKNNILVFVDYYLPGYNAGGPLRSIANLIDHLGDEFNFKIVSRDRDLGNDHPYSDIKVDAWQFHGKCEIYYCSPQSMSFQAINKIISSTTHDVLYLNSFFSPTFTIKPLILRHLGFIPQNKLILAPRGEFSKGALLLNYIKKRAYIYFSKALQLYSGVTWQASSVYEKKDIQRFFPSHPATVIIAPDLPSSLSAGSASRMHKKLVGHLKLVFLSRISPKKNLDGALRMLDGVNGSITYNIFGPIEDEIYWEKCMNIIDSLPDNIKVQYLGAIANEQVAKVLAEHDLFFFPTYGENFGHVILEAFASGCPVLISDQTPWQDLKGKGVGWNLPLNRPDLFYEALHACLEMDEESLKSFSERAKIYGRETIMNQVAVDQNRQLFNSDSNS